MRHLRKFDDFRVDEGLKDKFKSAKEKIKTKATKIKNLKWEDIKNYGNKFYDFMKREGGETAKGGKILKKMLAQKDVSENEKKFLKEQSKDILRIIATGTLPMPITAALVALGKKYNFEMFPGDQEELLKQIEREKEMMKESLGYVYELNESINVSDLPKVPEELEDMLRMGYSGQFRNRIIVDINDNWFEYNKGLYSQPEWHSIDYSTYTDPQGVEHKGDKEETRRIIFDQDVIPGSETDKESKAFKKWLESEGIDVTQVYLGET